MTQTTAAPDAAQQQAPGPPHFIPRPQTDAAALRAIANAKEDLHQRAEHIRSAPQDHKPKLVLSNHVAARACSTRSPTGSTGSVGSMWVFVGITTGIVVWLFPATSSASTRRRGRCC